VAIFIGFSRHSKENVHLKPALPQPPIRHIRSPSALTRRKHMNGVIYLVGLVVVVMFVLSVLGLR
jgi:hypothetical protein